MSFLDKKSILQAITNAAKTVAKGSLKVADKGLTAGVVHNVIEKTTSSEKGSLDPSKLFRTFLGSTIPVGLLIALIKKWITIEELIQLLSIFN